MDIQLKDYLHFGNTTLALIHALEDCEDGSTLHLGGGKLYFDGEFATSDSYYLPRYSDIPKLYAFYVKDKKNFTIDGDGAELIFKDNVSAFGFFDCENVTLKNLTVDYEYPCFWQAKITNVTDNGFEVETDEENFGCRYDSVKRQLAFFKKGEDEPAHGCSSMLANEFEADGSYGKASPDFFLCVGGEPHEFYPFMSRLFDVTQTDNKIRFTLTSGEMPTLHEGLHLTATDHERRNNTVYFYRCKNIAVENINLYTSPSFGVLGLLCENVTIDNVNSIRKPGTDRKLAVVADMFHFVNTKGAVTIRNSVVENIKDDCVNIHSLYTRVVKKLAPNKILVDCPYLAKKILNLYRPGDRIKAVDTADFVRPEKFYTVKSSVFRGRYCLEIELEENAEDICEENFITAFEYEPSLHIDNCRFGNNRGRGILAQTAGEVLVENSRIYTPHCSFLIGGCSRIYMEGTPAQSITLRGNIFDGSNYPHIGRFIAVSGSVKTDEVIYGKLVAEENTFKMSSGNIIADLRLFDTVCFENNTVEGLEDDGSLYRISQCRHVSVN